MRRRLTPQPLKWKESFCGSSSWWFASFISGFILHRPWAAASFSAWQNWLIGARVLFGVSVWVETFRVASIRASGKAYRHACSRSSCAAIVCCAAAAFSTGRSAVAHTTAAQWKHSENLGEPFSWWKLSCQTSRLMCFIHLAKNHLTFYATEYTGNARKSTASALSTLKT